MGLKLTGNHPWNTLISLYCTKIESLWAPCAYLRDTDNLDDYRQKNQFLALLNNEREHDK